MPTTTPAGYTYGDPQLPPSPVTVDDLALLRATLLWTDDDTSAIRRAGKILEGQSEQILDVWYGFVGANSHLVATFAGADGAPDPAYLGAVRARFARWITDICMLDWDQAWLDHQHALGQRHHASGKNRTDGIASTSTEVPLRYLIAFIFPITATIRQFLANGAADPADLEAMHTAWFKAVTLTVTLWAQPYSTSW